MLTIIRQGKKDSESWMFRFLFICFWRYWGFEVIALCLLVRCFTPVPWPSVLFALVVLEIGSWFLPRPSSYFKLPTIARMTGIYHHIQLFPLRWCLKSVLSGLAWNLYSLHFGLPHGLEWHAHATVPSYWLGWDLTTLRDGFELWSSKSQPCLPSS
jgi:hypothetical protein